MKIVMVCLGNICRSPLAEGILRSKTDASVTIDSAGTGAWHAGQQPDKRSIEIARRKGIDISTQRARQFTVQDYSDFDLIYVMDRSNYANVLELAPDEKARQKVKLILEEVQNSPVSEVPDPYYGENDGFSHVFELLDNACTVIAERIKQNAY
ncbi:low molecular weight protein-tyrosine-phosphatase [Myroides ceti]|uniref:protein-tyrosine-phosphatase n=2 Tax=Paenimyroides ceti TaxID=395087 RepID=A0ABT8CU36_9FLAO|nr:low molecular weight protein-tyrosine-phosphatase [Paenimyroides ceti]MDN3707699.1 low molecular weight protein-tyrosine-phosphatase [Paenimyroides ceti]